MRPNAAGVDLGFREHWVAVPAARSPQPVRAFGTYTEDLQALADWLKECRVDTVAMEATGVYWIALFQILEARGFEVLLVNARQIKNVSGRKSDVADCQWIQRLHSYGLLGASFRPADAYCVMRSYLRYRDELVAARTTQNQHMQKALQQMNVQLKQVLSDVTGLSGRLIIEAILKGERNPLTLAALADRRVKSTQGEMAKALVGDFRAEHLYVLQCAFELYRVYEEKIAGCDVKLTAELARLPDRVNIQVRPLPPKVDKKKKIGEGLRQELYQKLGVDLTAIEGFGPLVSWTVLTELGPDVSRFKTGKHFASWLGLCPDNRVSGGKVLSCRTRRVVNRLSDALRLAATTLERSPTALGAYHRRMKARLGAAEGITATAHRLARTLYSLLKNGEPYVRLGLEEYERKYQERRLSGLRKAAKTMGFTLVQNEPAPAGVS